MKTEELSSETQLQFSSILSQEEYERCSAGRANLISCMIVTGWNAIRSRLSSKKHHLRHRVEPEATEVAARD
ncbi:hypothetical protein LOM8899_01399 [Flavimaricola marinus]|uniref:Uncharacterized protein n=1 Tax=Flavimaricola marinus TaxID=1819565 RepID=A0A238LE78_9RHOB|nr:hypothetical protein LOM8899_01399 [Flavimaricola marinus]